VARLARRQDVVNVHDLKGWLSRSAFVGVTMEKILWRPATEDSRPRRTWAFQLSAGSRVDV